MLSDAKRDRDSKERKNIWEAKEKAAKRTLLITIFGEVRYERIYYSHICLPSLEKQKAQNNIILLAFENCDTIVSIKALLANRGLTI